MLSRVVATKGPVVDHQARVGGGVARGVAAEAVAAAAVLPKHSLAIC